MSRIREKRGPGKSLAPFFCCIGPLVYWADNWLITIVRLLANNLTEMASNNTPKNFLSMNSKLLPKILLILSRYLKTTKSIKMLRPKPIMMFNTLYSARRESKAVNAPGPAIRGNAIGTMEAPPGLDSFLMISMPRIISMARMKSTTAPATAKEAMSTPNNSSIASPAKKKATNRPSAARHA